MDFLKKDMAPIPSTAWEEVEERASEVIKSQLSTRKVFKVNGPKGLGHTVVSEGRLDVLNNEAKNNEVKSGTYEVKPLVEARIPFELSRWELDNLMRGANDIVLGPLEDAAKKIALFEESAVYKGLNSANIAGLDASTEHEPIKLGKEPNEIMENISTGILTLRDAFIDQALILIVGQEAWKRINQVVNGFPLKSAIEKLLQNKVIYSPVIDGSYLVPYDHDDLELTVGQDFAIGYESHGSKTVKLFLTESFTFRVLDPAIILKYNL